MTDPLLRYNPSNGYFVLTAEQPRVWEEAEKTGLTRSIADVISRERTYFTNEPHAALHFWDAADNTAKAALADLRAAYDGSFADRPSPGGPEVIIPDKEVLFPFQTAGVQYALGRKMTLIGDEPGLGKTPQAIAATNSWAEALPKGGRRFRGLLVVPANVRIMWQRALRRWSTIPGLQSYAVAKAADGVNPHSHFTIISYELARNPAVLKALMKLDYDVMICDEAHYMKTMAALRTKALLGGYHDGVLDWRPGLMSRAAKTVFLTGTPLPNRPRECYTIARALSWDAIDWSSYNAFEHRYNPSYFGEEDSGRLPELRARLRCNFMIRRLKKDVMKDLPQKRYELTYIEPNGAIKRALRKERMLDISLSDLDNPNVEVIGHISAARHEMGVAKVPRVLEHCRYLLDGGVEKMILFAWHREVMKQLQEGLAKHGVVRLDGSTGMLERQRVVDEFQENPDCRIFLGQVKAAGVGITLTAASHVVFAEASWTPADNEQCVDRAHRIGQTSSVLAQFLVVADSMDERVLGAAIKKYRVIYSALDETV